MLRTVFPILLVTACGGGITEIVAGEGLTGGGTGDVVTVSLDAADLQTRVDDSCPSADAVGSVGEDGSVTCNGPFADEVHDHGTTYATAAHDHDADYLPTAGFDGHNNKDCVDGGYVVIGNFQEEFGCSVTCEDMCANHGLTCERAFTVGGTFRTCSSINNNEALYCWCTG